MTNVPDIIAGGMLDIRARGIGLNAKPPESFRLWLTCFCGSELRLRPNNGARATCRDCGAIARYSNERVSLEAMG